MEESINPQQDPKQEQDQQQKEQSTGSNPEQKAEASDVEKNKLMAVIGYVLPILFFIPLLTDAKESKFAMFHANQHLVLLIFVIAVNAFGTIIPILGWFLICFRVNSSRLAAKEV